MSLSRSGRHVAPGRLFRPFPSVYTASGEVYTYMAKHLVDLDERALKAARLELGTKTIKDTRNDALHRATGLRRDRVASALDVLADARLDDRDDAWR